MNVFFAILSYAIAAVVSLGAAVQSWRRKKTAEANVRPIAGEQLIDQLDEIVMIIDDDNRVIDVNQAAQHLIGKPMQEIIGQTTMSLFPESIELIQRFSGINEAYTEIEVPSPNGNVHFDIKLKPLHNPSGNYIGRLVVAHDITALKRAQAELSMERANLQRTIKRKTAALTKANQQLMQEMARQTQMAQKLKEQDERLRLLADATFEGIAITENGVVVQANQQMANILGTSLDDLLDKPIIGYIAPELRGDVPRLIRAGIATLSNQVALKKDGTRIPVEIRARTIKQDNRELRLLAVRDMTDYLVAQQAVKESEERFRLIIENMPILLDAFDENNNLIAWNRACEETTGYTADEMINNPRAMEILYPDPDYRKRMWQAALDPNSHETTFDLVTKNGETRTIMWFETFRHLAVPGWASWGLGLDVTERRRAEDALRESEKRYRAIVEDQTEFIVRWLPDGTRTFANAAYCRYFGQTYDEIVGTSFFPLIVEEDRQMVRNRLNALTLENPVSTDTYQVIKPDSSRGWQEWTDRALFDDQGRLIEMQSVGRDHTQRVLAEQAEREQRALNEALTGTATALNSMLELEAVLESVLSNLARAVKFDAANIMLIENGTGRIARASGYPDNTLPKGTEYPLSQFKTIKRLSKASQPIIIADTLADPLWYPSPQSRWVRSVIGAPIRLKGKVIGAIFVDSAVPNFFTEKDAAHLQAFANQAAIAIHNARLYESEREQRALNEALVETSALLNSTLSQQEVLNLILNNLEQMLKHDAANVMLLEGDTARIVGKRGYSRWGLDDAIEQMRFPVHKRNNLQTMMRTLKPLVVPDTYKDSKWVRTPEFSWVRSYAGAPIQVSGEVIGFLNLSSATPNFFDAKAIERLTAVANQVAIAVNNARLYESERKERKLAETLQQTASTLLRTLNIHDTLNIIMDQLAQVVQYDQAMLLSVEDSMLRVKADRGLPNADNLIERTYDYASLDVVKDLLASGSPLILANMTQQAEASSYPGVVAETRSWMAIPLLAWEIVTGLLIVGSNRVDAFDTEIARAATAFAQQAAIAIQNVRIMEELSETVRRLREAQARLTGAARLAAAGEIAAGVAHQLNNPLTAVIAEVSLILKHISPEDPDYESAINIQAAAEKAATIVHRQLNLSKSIPYEMVETDTNKSVAEALALVRAQIEPSARLLADLAPDLPPIMASPEHLSDVWLNLLLNARDGIARKPNGIILVRTHIDPQQNGVIIVVEDNGEGIPRENLERIFDPFYTTRPSGHGLGLPVCYEVVRRHNGTIQVDSREGTGTTIKVTLPIASRSEPASSHMPRKMKKHERSNRR